MTSAVATTTAWSPLRGVRQILFVLTTLIGLTLAVHAQQNVSVDDVAVLEGDSGITVATFTISLDIPAVLPITVTYATNAGTATEDVDYIGTAGSVVFETGQMTQTVNVDIVGDTVVEGDETFTLELTGVEGDATIVKGTGVGTILDDDLKISIADGSALEVSDTLTTTVTISEPVPFTVTVDAQTLDGTAVAGEDYSPASGTLTFLPGETEKVVNIDLIENSEATGSRTFSIELSNPTNSAIERAVGVMTIVVEGSVDISINDVSVRPGTGPSDAVFVVTLSEASGQTVTVDYATEDGTASAPSSYASATGTLTFDAGQISQTIVVTVVGDRQLVVDETFTVVLSNASPNAVITRATGVGTILKEVIVVQARTLIYNLAVRGTRFGTGAGPIHANGYLVLDHNTGAATALLKYSDGSGSVQRWHETGLWYTIDVGPANYWVLSNRTEVVDPAYSYAQMLGKVHPNQVNIGGSQSDVVATMTGDVRVGDATGNGAFGRANINARILLDATRVANMQGLSYDEVVENLQQNLGIVTSESSAVGGEIGVSESNAIVLYHLTGRDLEAGDGGVDRSQIPGLLLIDFGTKEVVFIEIWRQGNNRFYEVQEWAVAQPIWYTLALGPNSYHVMGGANVDDESDFETIHSFLLAYGLNKVHPLGTGVNQSVPFVLHGEIFEHEISQFSDGDIYLKMDWSANIRPETVTLNQGNMSMEEAIQWVLDNMLSGYTDGSD